MVEESRVYEEMAVIFAKVFEREIALSPGLSAKDVADWDSFKQIEILIATEMRFRLKFTSAEVNSMRALCDLVAIVAARGTLA